MWCNNGTVLRTIHVAVWSNLSKKCLGEMFIWEKPFRLYGAEQTNVILYILYIFAQSHIPKDSMNSTAC